MRRVAIIGSGISGLTAAHYVRKLAPLSQITIFEQSNDYGGWLKTNRIPVYFSQSQKYQKKPSHYITFESGPASIRTTNILQSIDNSKNHNNRDEHNETDSNRHEITNNLINELNLTPSVVYGNEKVSKNRFICLKNKEHRINNHGITRYK